MMRLAGTIARACAAAILLAAVAAPVAAQIQPRDEFRRTLPSGPQAPRPGAPYLIAPADGETINAISGVPTLTFRWGAPSAPISVTFYRLTFENADNPGAFTSAPIDVRISRYTPRITRAQVIPPALRGARIRWSVRACNDAPVLTTVGGPTGNCGEAASRILNWSASPQPPRLSSPAHGAYAAPRSAFTWSTQQGANSYLFCLSRPGVACPLNEIDNANTIVVRRVGNSNTVAAPDTSRFLGQSMNWTAASCGPIGACVYQQSFRSVTIGAPPSSNEGEAVDGWACREFGRC